MIRYPIFVFNEDGGRPAVYDTVDHAWSAMWDCCDDCSKDCAAGLLLFDSEGRLLTIDETEDSGWVVESGDRPDPQRLRQLLASALERKHSKVSSNASLDALVTEAHRVYGFDPRIFPAVSDTIGRALTVLRRKKPAARQNQ